MAWQEHMLLERAMGIIANGSGNQEWEEARREFMTAYGDVNNKQRPVKVEGRHTERCLTSPAFVAKATKRPGLLEIRVDDSNHPDFWLEIEVPDGAITVDQTGADEPCAVAGDSTAADDQEQDVHR